MATEPETPEAALAAEPAVPSLLDSYFTRWYEAGQGDGICKDVENSRMHAGGERPLKTSQDLIHQLEVFAEEGLKLASSVQVFSKQLKDDDKFMLLLEINKLVLLCYQLQAVDQSITKTRGIMAIFNQLLSFCYKLLKKLQMENNRRISVTNKDSVDGKTLESLAVRSLEHHVAKLTFLESR